MSKTENETTIDQKTPVPGPNTRTLTVYRDGREGCGLLKDEEGTVLAKFFTDTDMTELMAPYKGWKAVEAGPGVEGSGGA